MFGLYNQLMASIHSYSSIDFKPQTSVPVIASFDTEGHIAPLYVRLNGNSHKVLSYWIRNGAFVNTIEFSCKIEDNGFEKPLLLKYYYEESTWVISR